VKDYPYWQDTVNSQFTSYNLQGSPQSAIQSTIHNPQSAIDVAVIGSGYTGLSAARRLAKVGASVVVLDREDVGSGASSRNAGQVLTGLRLDVGTLLERYGESHARELFDAASHAIDHLEQLIADESIACDYERTGHLQAAWKPQHFDAMRKEQTILARVFNHRVDLLSRAEQQREIGSPRYHGVLVDPRSGALNPARYVHGLAAAATRAGVRLARHTPVTRIARDGRRWRLTTPSGEMSATDVILATNGYTDGVAPALQCRLVPIGSYIVVTEPLPDDVAAAILPTRRMAFDSKHFLYYFRLTADHRLLFGGRPEFSEPDAAATRRAAGRLGEGIATIFPQLSRVTLDYAWSGRVAFTRDEMPRAGRLDDLSFAGGYCGHGIALATELGDLVARRIAGERIVHPLVDRPFPPIPLYRGRPWFLPLAGAYYRVKDWMS
jgi:glycine/D-amino acid oxidase-like deaminating enzyme